MWCIHYGWVELEKTNLGRALKYVPSIFVAFASTWFCYIDILNEISSCLNVVSNITFSRIIRLIIIIAILLAPDNETMPHFIKAES